MTVFTLNNIYFFILFLIKLSQIDGSESCNCETYTNSPPYTNCSFSCSLVSQCQCVSITYNNCCNGSMFYSLPPPSFNPSPPTSLPPPSFNPSPPPSLSPPESSVFWCQTLESEYTHGAQTSCTQCSTTSDCLNGRECWGSVWCKENTLCGNEECSNSETITVISPPPLQSLSPLQSPPPLQSLSPPPPLPSLSPQDNSEDTVLQYFKEIGLPIIIAVIGLIGSIVGRMACIRNTKTRQKTRQKKRINIIKANLELEDEENDSNESKLGSNSESNSEQNIKLNIELSHV